MRLSRTFAAGVGAVLLATAPVAAFAETDDDDDYAAYGSPGQLAIHLEEAHGYTDVTCSKEITVLALDYTIDAQDYPDAIALRLQGTQTGKRLVLDPVLGKAYPSPEGEGTKLNWVIICSGQAPVEPTDPVETTDPSDPTETDEPTATETEQPTGPPIETDGPAQRPGNVALWLGAGTILAGAGALFLGRRLNHDG